MIHTNTLLLYFFAYFFLLYILFILFNYTMPHFYTIDNTMSNLYATNYTINIVIGVLLFINFLLFFDKILFTLYHFFIHRYTKYNMMMNQISIYPQKYNMPLTITTLNSNKFDFFFIDKVGKDIQYTNIDIQTNIDIFISILSNFPSTNQFVFFNSNSGQRHFLYKTLSHMSINYTKDVDRIKTPVISVNITPNIRNNIITYRTNNPYLIKKQLDPYQKLSDNTKIKNVIAGLIFDVKNNIPEDKYKIIMETLNKVH